MYRASNTNLPLRTQQQACSNVCVIEYYEHTVPPFVAAALDAMYAGAKNASTYVAREGATALAILQFHRHRHRVQVINENLQLSAMEVARFVDFVFMRFPATSMVSFRAIKVNLQSLRRPYLQTKRSQEHVHIFRSRRAKIRHAGLIFATYLLRE